jgi:hypothetical protein
MKGKSNAGQPGPKGRTQAAQGINAAMQYIEDEHGIPVDGHRATIIRANAQRIWFQLLEHDLAPETWGVASLNVSKQYNEEMLRQAPELGYCDDNWKAQYIGTQNYSSWYATHGARKVMKIKGETTDLGTAMLVGPSNAKRGRTVSAGSLAEGPKKKAKAAVVSEPNVTEVANAEGCFDGVEVVPAAIHPVHHVLVSDLLRYEHVGNS